jgi:uncharacterized protein
MARFVWLLVVVLAVIALVRGLRRRRTPLAPTRSRAPHGKAVQPQAMVRCAHCGVHLAEADALQAPDGRHYCSEPHRLAGPGPRSGG